MCLWFCKLLPLGETGSYRGRVCHRGSTNVSNGSGNGPQVQPPQGECSHMDGDPQACLFVNSCLWLRGPESTCGCTCSLTCLFRKQAAQARSVLAPASLCPELTNPTTSQGYPLPATQKLAGWEADIVFKGTKKNVLSYHHPHQQKQCQTFWAGAHFGHWHKGWQNSRSAALTASSTSSRSSSVHSKR